MINRGVWRKINRAKIPEIRTFIGNKLVVKIKRDGTYRARLVALGWIQETCLISAVTSGPTEPKTFQEAWYSPVEEEKENWDISIRKEIRSMINRGVWRKINRAKIPENRTFIGNKLVVKIKRDGTYRARLVALGWIQETCLISAVTSGPTEPKPFQEAWRSPVEEEKNCQISIRKELRSMINRGVWRKINRAKIPENRRFIGNKRVFKIKGNGTYRARLVALRYSQIPGIDYTDNIAPVASDVSFRIAMARMMVEKLDSLVIVVETAFLYGEIEEESFIKSPVGMEEIGPGSSPEDCYQLKKGIYGLCQAARQFWRKFVDTIKKEPFGFTVSPADSCMLFKENNLGICIIIIHVDDMLIICKKE